MIDVDGAEAERLHVLSDHPLGVGIVSGHEAVELHGQDDHLHGSDQVDVAGRGVDRLSRDRRKLHDSGNQVRKARNRSGPGVAELMTGGVRRGLGVVERAVEV